jgi:hypothetical protein
MTAIVEFHGFKDNNNRFILKELAIVSENFQCQIIFKTPFGFNRLNEKMRRTAQWVTRHVHHIKWNADGIDFNKKMLRELVKPYKVIYTKGLEKVEYLKQFHNDVREIDWDKTDPGQVNCLLSQHRGNEDVKCALYSAKSYSNKNKGSKRE